MANIPSNLIPIDGKKLIQHICSIHGIKLTYNDKNCEDNQAYCTRGKDPKIMLGNFEDKEIEMAAFFHELGHILSPTKHRGRIWETMSAEGMAWELGFEEAAKYGFFFYGNDKVKKYALNCYASYWNSEYNKDLREESEKLKIEKANRKKQCQNTKKQLKKTKIS